MSIRGRIVWTRAIEGAGRYRVGVQFTHYDGLTREDLAARIEALASR